MQLVLVHSPALGPGSWRWVADVLADRGHEVVVPDRRGAMATGDPAAFVAAAAADPSSPSGGRVDAVVGHSGAGPLLPAIAERTATRCVFVDAGLPVDGPDPFLDRLRDLAVDGVLPPWSTWFGPDVLATLVPDPAHRTAIEADEPRVPLAFYEAQRPRVPLPAQAGYVLLSEAYRAEADRAAALGWAVVEHPSTHLGLVTDPDGVADAILEVLA
ncbi:MAG TPA: hypothetical protein VK507_04395 [Iamia sp.]|nr:hypothetical protein [Iamia sp.]